MRACPPAHVLRLAGLGLLASLFSGCAASRPIPPLAAEGALAITNVTVIDMTGAAPRANQTVVMRGTRIHTIGPAGRTALPPGAIVVEGRGKYLIPGLWDMHVHAWIRDTFALAFLANGVTGVREMGSGIGVARPGGTGPFGWRADIAAGIAPGPRMVAAGFILDGGDSTWYKWTPFFKVVRTPEQGREWVDTLVARGADFVKVYRSLPPAVYTAITQRAKELGIPFAGHVPSLVGARAASDAGQRSIEHLTDFLVSASSEEAAIRELLAKELRTDATQSAIYFAEEALTERLIATYDAAKAQALAERFQRNGTWHVPTLVVWEDPRVDDPEAVADPIRLAALPRYLHPFIRPRDTLSAEARARTRRLKAQNLDVVSLLHRTGVPLLAGTDVANAWIYPGFSLHDELALMVRAGLSPAEALRTATRNPAEYLGMLDSLGTIEPGKLADLVLLSANPLQDITNTTRIHAVVMNGQLLSRPRLDDMLRR